MKKLLIGIILLFASYSWGATLGTEISKLPLVTSPGLDSRIPLVIDPTTAPATRGITIGNLLNTPGYVDIRSRLPVGYVTDGSVDYSTYVNAINDEGKVVYIPPNFTLGIGANVLWNDAIGGGGIVGAGYNSVIKFLVNNIRIYPYSVSGLTFANFRINGNNKTGTVGITFQLVTKSVAYNLWIHDIEEGIFFSVDASRIKAHHNFFWNIVHNAGSATSATYCEFTDNTIDTAGGGGWAAIGFEPTSNSHINQYNKISRNIILNTTGDAINMQKGSAPSATLANNEITGNMILTASGNGISIQTADRAVISENTTESTGKSGIYSDNSSYLSIARNVIRNPHRTGGATENSGIKIITGGQYLSIVDNVISCTDAGMEYGIDLSTSAISYNSVLSGNVIQGANTKEINYAGIANTFRQFGWSSNTNIGSHTPASATEACYQGEIAADADYIYFCTANNTWKRGAIATWP